MDYFVYFVVCICGLLKGQWPDKYDAVVVHGLDTSHTYTTSNTRSSYDYVANQAISTKQLYVACTVNQSAVFV